MKNTPGDGGQSPQAGGGGKTPANVRVFQNRSGGFPKKTGSAEVGSGKPVVSTVFLGDPRFWDTRGSNPVGDDNQGARGRGGNKPTRRTRETRTWGRGGAPAHPAHAPGLNGRRATGNRRPQAPEHINRAVARKGTTRTTIVDARARATRPDRLRRIPAQATAATARCKARAVYR